MALQVVTHEYVHTDDDWEDHSTLYATRIQGDYYVDRGVRSEGFESKGWHIQGSDLIVYPEEMPAYMELFRKLMAVTDDAAQS